NRGIAGVILDAEVVDSDGPDQVLGVQQLGIGVGYGTEEPTLAVVDLVALEFIGVHAQLRVLARGGKGALASPGGGVSHRTIRAIEVRRGPLIVAHADGGPTVADGGNRVLQGQDGGIAGEGYGVGGRYPRRDSCQGDARAGDGDTGLG